MIGNIGPLEIGVVLIIALMVFGPKRLPELGSSLGRGIRSFGKGIKGEVDDPPASIESEERSEMAESSSTGAVGADS